MIIIQVITPAAATRWTPTNATTVAPPPSWWPPRWGGTRWCARSWRASVANAGKRPGLQWKNGENHGKKVMGKKRKIVKTIGKVMEKRGKWWKPWEKWWKKCENGEHHGKSDGKKVRMVEHMGNKNMNMLGFVYIQLSTIWDRQNVEEMVECWKTLWTWWKISDIQEFRCSSRANMGFQWSLPWDVLKLEYLILRWKIRRTILVLSKKNAFYQTLD